MEHVSEEQIGNSLMKWLDAASLTCSEPQVRLLVSSLLAVLAENERVNLTSVRAPLDAARRMTLDSLTAIPEVQTSPAGVLLDLGSGGGFPGIPLSIATGRETVLLDSVGKKMEAVRRVVDSLGLSGISCVWARAEEHAAHNRGSYAVVVARACAELPVIQEWASPLLSHNGRLICMKGDPTESELARGDTAAGTLGLTLDSMRRTSLPVGGESRTIIVYRKTGPGSVSLPRQIGLARRQPLA